MTDQVERRLQPTKLQAAPGGRIGKKLEGHAALFDVLSQDLGGFVERIEPGAFSNALRKSDVRALFNHDRNQVLGRTKSGTLRLREDSKGLFMSVDPPDTQAARDLLVLVSRGDVDQTSFGFRVAEGGDSWHTDGSGRQVRTITEVADLLDVSVVVWPAYSETVVSARALELAGAAPRRRGVPIDILRKKLDMAELAAPASALLFADTPVRRCRSLAHMRRELAEAERSLWRG